MIGPPFSALSCVFCLLTCHPCMRSPLHMWYCRSGSLQAEVMRSVFGLCATGSTPKNEVMRWDSESRGFIRLSLRLHKVLLSQGCTHEAAVPHAHRTELTNAAGEIKSTKEGVWRDLCPLPLHASLSLHNKLPPVQRHPLSQQSIIASLLTFASSASASAQGPPRLGPPHSRLRPR